MKPGRDWEVTFGAEGPHIRAYEYSKWARFRRRCAEVFLVMLGSPDHGRFLGRINAVQRLAVSLSVRALAWEYMTHRTVLDLLIAEDDALNADPEAAHLFKMLEDVHLPPE